MRAFSLEREVIEAKRGYEHLLQAEWSWSVLSWTPGRGA